MFTGAIIKETITSELLLDFLKIDKVELWKTADEEIKYWTMIFFSSNTIDFPERLAKVLINGWFADMKQDNVKYIVFKDCVYRYTIDNVAEKSFVLNEMRKRGIPDEQFNWDE